MKKKKLLLSFATLSAVFLICACNSSLTTTHYRVTVKNLPESLEGSVIVHLSDLHSTLHGENQQKLASAIKKENPDLIFMTGDILDDHKENSPTWILIEQIKDLCPIFYVSGNHEVWSRELPAFYERFESLGVSVLRNESRISTLKGENILISGLCDPAEYDYYENVLHFSEALKKVKETNASFDGPAFLLCHRPEYRSEYEDLGYDLVLNGHAHGGQGRIPFILPNGLIAPNQGFFPTLTNGVHPFKEGGAQVISRGLSILDIPRVFNRPEVVSITLTSEE